MPYRCDGDDANPVVVIITDQIEAETIALCAEHYPAFVRAMYDAMFPTPEPVKAASKPRGGRKGKADAPAELDGQLSAVPDPESGDDTDEDEAADAQGPPTEGDKRAAAGARRAAAT